MSKQQGGNFDIPLPLIILGYILSPPVGVVLTLLKVFSGGETKRNAGNAEKSIPQKTNSAEKTETKKTVRHSRISVPALVLFIIAGVFLFCAAANLIDGGSLGDSLILLLCSGASVVPGMICKGKHDRRNVIRSVIGKRETMFLAQLSAAADIPVRRLRKDLQAMINNGEFGDEAFIDMASGRFLRSPEVAEAFSESVYGTLEPGVRSDISSPDAETDEFRAIILQIRKLNDDIKDYAVSERIYRIEEHTQNIFDYVTAHPEAMSQIRSFMNYYLPTTLKLLESYSRIEQVGVAGENMKNSKENIERILDMLVVGYKQQVDQLFRNESMDISSEIKVLEAMMKQDGLDGRTDFDPGFSDDLTAGSAAAQKKTETDE